MITSWSFWHKIYSFSFAPETLSSPVNPDIGALNLVFWLGECEVVLQHSQLLLHVHQIWKRNVGEVGEVGEVSEAVEVV